MTPSVQAPGAAPLPPLPDLQSAKGTGGAPAGGPNQQDAMAALISAVGPTKVAVDAIIANCKQIVQSGAVPGAEQPCAQIIALATSLLPMAAQQALQPSGGMPMSPMPGAGAGPGAGAPPAPPAAPGPQGAQ